MSFGMVQSINRADSARRDAERRALRRRAKDTVLGRLPDLRDPNGDPCSFAVYAVLALWSEHGEGTVTPRQVREFRAGHIARVESRFADRREAA